MRIVECAKEFTEKGRKFEAGHKYVMAEDTEQNYRNLYGQCMGMSYPIDPVYRPYKGQDLNGKRIMAFRSGGIGDIFFLQPSIRYLKKLYPKSFIRAASGCKEPLENVPEIDELYDMPFDANLLNDVDMHLLFQGIIETSSEMSKRTHAVDMFFSYFGIDSIQLPAEDKRPRLFFTDKEVEWCKQTTVSLGITDADYVVGIQMETSAPLRNFPKEKMKAVIDILSREENTKIVLVGTAEQHGMIAGFFKGGNPNVIPALTFNVRQSIVLASRYDLIISPDSFMVQAAGAMDKPLVGLYGPFPSEVRMKYFKNAVGLDPAVVCSPCYKHDFRACIKGFPSPCFTQMNIEDVLKSVDYLKSKMTGRHMKCMEGILKTPNLSEIEKYMLSADKGVCFFSGHYTHHNIIRVDPDIFVKPDISDMNGEFNKDAYPFVLYLNRFDAKYRPVFENSKKMVRPGGYYIAYAENAPEQFFNDIARDLGTIFSIMFSKFDPVTRTMVIVGKKSY
jgi:ADP-heptose:LPS heptosyltransferase